jgi:hypothetical protein
MGLWEIEIDNLRGVESRVYQIERVWVFGQTSESQIGGKFADFKAKMVYGAPVYPKVLCRLLLSN